MCDGFVSRTDCRDVGTEPGSHSPLRTHTHSNISPNIITGIIENISSSIIEREVSDLKKGQIPLTFIGLWVRILQFLGARYDRKSSDYTHENTSKFKSR